MEVTATKAFMWVAAAAAALITVELAMPMGRGEGGLLAASTLPLLVLLVLGGYLLATGHARRRLEASVAGWMLFVAVAATTLGWSGHPGETRHGLASLLFIAAMFVVLVAVELPPRFLDVFERTVIWAGAAAAMWGLVTFAAGATPAGRSGTPRFTAVGNANATAAALLLPFVLALGAALGGRAGRALPRVRTGNHIPGRAVDVALVAVILTGIVLTGSRGGLVAVAAAALTFALVSRRRADLLRIAVVVVVVVGLAYAALPASTQAHLMATDSTGRTGLWAVAVEACDRHCILGSGYGTFPDVYTETFRASPAAGGWHTADFKAHNIWLEAAVELGVPGVLALLAAVGATLAAALRASGRRRSQAVAALAAVLVATMFLSHIGFRYFWLVMAYATLCAAIGASQPTPAIARLRSTR